MKPVEPHLLRRVVQSVLDARGSGVTRVLTLDAVIAVRLPTEEIVWYGAASGAQGSSESIVFARGPVGLRSLRMLADGLKPDAQLEREVAWLCCDFVPVHTLAPVRRAALQQAGFASGEMAPDLTAKARRQGRTSMDRRDLKTFEMLTLALMRCFLADLIDADDARDRGALPTVRVVIVDGKPLVDYSEEVHADDEGVTQTPVRLSDATKSWPLLDESWVVAFGTMTSPGGEPFRVLVVGWADDGTAVTLMQAPGVRAAARSFVRGEWLPENRDPGFAREMIFVDPGLRGAVAEALEGKGVACVLVASHPGVDAMLLQLAGIDHGEEPGDELAAWRKAAQRLDAELGRRVREGGAIDEAFRAYFGSWKPALENEDDEAVFSVCLQSMIDWAAYSWRRRPNAPTVAERLLREETDDRSRALVEAHAAALPSFYAVRETDADAGTLVVEDVFTGERTTVQDRALSKSAVLDLVLPLRVVPAGEFRLVWLAGPHATDVSHFLDEIERCGVAPTREGIQARPEVLGRLWRLEWERRKNPALPRLQNADGDPILFHEALYSLTDGDVARKALLSRKDLDYDERGDAFTWTRPTKRGEERYGDNVVLGSLRIVGDELLASANSAARWRRMRAWLDSVPGVEFRKVGTKDMDDLRSREVPVDDRLPDAEPFVVPPEAMAALAQYMDEHWRTWPDVALPMLEGKTPREACAAPEGRSKVVAFVRTLTSPHPSIDIAAVRERLLRDLGLAGG